ncbi:NAD(+)/NADH kinase [bacterium]|nr:NAD(+)/NADH kinase [bacterium]
MKIQNIAIIYRDQTPRAQSLAEEVCIWLKKKNLTVFFQKGKATQKDCAIFETPEQIKNLHLVVVLGGDGTYLEAVRFLGDQQVPVLGVNLGSLGFLTENRVDEVFEVLEHTLNGKMKKEPLALLSVEVKSAKSQKFIALNDIVIERGQSTHLLNIGMYWNGDLVTETKADGMIISSPTGSTAYNLAAGGPILQPDVHAIVSTPICPHSLTSRPIIFPDDKVLSVRILGQKRSGILSIDGQRRADIDENCEILIQRHKLEHIVLRKASHNFFSLLREKLKFGERD